MTKDSEALKKHYEWAGKIEVISRAPVTNREDLALAYTPGVADACMRIADNPEEAYKLTRKNNLVAVITNGTAVLGLGNIGSQAAMPVMEGKCILLKEFADVDAFPISVESTDVDEVVETIKQIAGSFGAINLEDIAAPECFEIERRLINELDIPVFHDDQHGTAIVVGAAIINALKLKNDKKSIYSVIINDMKYSEVKANTPTLIALSPYKTYKIRIEATEDSDLTEYDNKSKYITLFPGNIGKLTWDVKNVFVGIGVLLDKDNNPICHQKIKGISDYVYTEDDGTFQANLTGEEKLYVKSSKYDCKIKLPKYDESDIVVDFGNIVCK